MRIKLGISIILALFAFIFITQNTETVMVGFLIWQMEMSLVLLVFIMLTAGIVIGWFLNTYLRFVRNRKQARVQEHIQTDKGAEAKDTEVVLRGDKETDE